MRVLTSAQMREADRRTISEHGISGLTLMENAGTQVVAAMRSAFPDLTRQRVAIVSGRGNNGGDGFVIARQLITTGVNVDAFVIGRAADIEGDARTNLEALRSLC